MFKLVKVFPFLLIVLRYVDSLAHVSDRQDVHNTLLSGGRVGMISSLSNLFADIRILQPSRLSTSPRWYSTENVF